MQFDCFVFGVAQEKVQLIVIDLIVFEKWCIVYLKTNKQHGD